MKISKRYSNKSNLALKLSAIWAPVLLFYLQAARNSIRAAEFNNHTSTKSTSDISLILPKPLSNARGMQQITAPKRPQGSEAS